MSDGSKVVSGVSVQPLNEAMLVLQLGPVPLPTMNRIQNGYRERLLNEFRVRYNILLPFVYIVYEHVVWSTPSSVRVELQVG